MKYTIYNPETGEITSVLSTHDESLAALNLSDKNYIEGEYDNQYYYVNNNEIISKEPPPSHNHIFDYTTKTWQLNLSKAIVSSRNNRNQLLTVVDRINPVWYASLTQDQQQELVAYRQQLLDVPQQAGFPTDIVWPAKPTWL